MMDSWRQYAFSIITCALFFSILENLISGSKHKNAIHLLVGIALAIIVLRPISSVDLENILDIYYMEDLSADVYVDRGEGVARSAQIRYIKESCEAYINNKAEQLGMMVSAEIALDQKYIPSFAEIQVISGAENKSELESIIATDLGITKENQKWILNQEKSSS